MNENNSSSSNKHPSPALLERFINVQEQEVVLRGQEIDLRKQNDANAHEYAKAAFLGIYLKLIRERYRMFIRIIR